MEYRYTRRTDFVVLLSVFLSSFKCLNHSHDYTAAAAQRYTHKSHTRTQTFRFNVQTICIKIGIPNQMQCNYYTWIAIVFYIFFFLNIYIPSVPARGINQDYRSRSYARVDRVQSTNIYYHHTRAHEMPVAHVCTLF